MACKTEARPRGVRAESLDRGAIRIARQRRLRRQRELSCEIRAPLAVPLSKRKVARRVDLALSTAPERFRTAADGVLDVVRDHRGYVLRSSVSGGDPDTPRSRLGRASFTLRIPAGELSAALGDLSDLGHVVSRTDGRVDITSRFVSAQKRIADVRGDAPETCCASSPRR